MRRYLRLLWFQLRASFAAAMEYRTDFVVDGLLSLWWMSWTLAPLWLVFQARRDVAGWSFPEALLVAAWFTVLRGILAGAINPSLRETAERIRMGTLDFVLVKPVDSQFLASTSRFAPWKVLDVGAGVAMVVIAFERLGRAPEPHHVALALLLLGCAVLVLYSLCVLVLAASLWVMRIDNLTLLFDSIFGASRWPVDIFRGPWRILFTFVLPVGVMTTYPARALLGTLDPIAAAAALAGAVGFTALSRLVWTRALARYSSASS